MHTLSSQGSKQSQSSKDSSQNNRKVVSPNSQAQIRTKRSRARKGSSHYQESDILESPQVYCRSNLGDKISDYEDLWTPENGNGNNAQFNKGPALSSFRSEHRPDLLPETRKLRIMKLILF